MKMGIHRLIGIFSLIILLLLCFYSLHEAPNHWGKMPSLDYVIENPGDFEGKEIYVDGMVRDIQKAENGVEFTLSPDPLGFFGSIKVKSNPMVIEERIQGANVHGRIEDGVLKAEDIIVSGHPVYFDVVLNGMGLLLFIYLSLEEWRITNRFPFIEVR